MRIALAAGTSPVTHASPVALDEPATLIEPTTIPLPVVRVSRQVALRPDPLASSRQVDLFAADPLYYRWALARQRRAPRSLRALVALLTLLLVAAVAGLVCIHLRPAWFPHATARPVLLRPSAPAVPRTVSTMTEIASTPASTTYALPDGRYRLGIVLDQRCWVVISSTAHPGGPVVAETLDASSSARWFRVGGTSTVQVAARTVRLVVAKGSRVLGSIASPVLGHTYVFQAGARR